MKNFQKNLKELEATDTQVLGVSMDSAFANKAFADQIGVTFPLLSDWGGKLTPNMEFFKTNIKGPAGGNFLFGREGKVSRGRGKTNPIIPTKMAVGVRGR